MLKEDKHHVEMHSFSNDIFFDNLETAIKVGCQGYLHSPYSNIPFLYGDIGKERARKILKMVDRSNVLGLLILTWALCRFKITNFFGSSNPKSKDNIISEMVRVKHHIFNMRLYDKKLLICKKHNMTIAMLVENKIQQLINMAALRYDDAGQMLKVIKMMVALLEDELNGQIVNRPRYEDEYTNFLSTIDIFACINRNSQLNIFLEKANSLFIQYPNSNS